MRKKGAATIPSKNDPQKLPPNCDAKEAKPNALQQSHASNVHTRSAKTHLTCARRFAKEEWLRDRIESGFIETMLRTIDCAQGLTLANSVNMQRWRVNAEFFLLVGPAPSRSSILTIPRCWRRSQLTRRILSKSSRTNSAKTSATASSQAIAHSP